MKRSYIVLVGMLLIVCILGAYPVPIKRLAGTKNEPLNPQSFCVLGNNLYVLDKGTRQIKAFQIDTQSITWNMFTLPKEITVSDMAVDERHFYFLDGKSSSVAIYEHGGKLVRKINTKGSTDAQFKKPLRIAVNYQGYIYVLDSTMLYAFTNEGMLIGSQKVNTPVSLSIGDDQLVRVMWSDTKGYLISHYNMNLKLINTVEVKTPENKKNMITDFCVNQYGDMHVIYGGTTRIGKINGVGAIIPHSLFGALDKSPKIGSFLKPMFIKCTPFGEASLMVILDTKQKAIHIFKDEDPTSSKRLIRPPYTMRPALEESAIPLCKDYLPGKDLSYAIVSIAFGDGKKKTDCLLAIDNDGKYRFATYLNKMTAKGIKSFSSLAMHQSELFVLDTDASKIHIFNATTGEYVSSFSDKGKRDGFLSDPTSIACSEDGVIFVSDTGNARIAMFNIHKVFIDNIKMKEAKMIPQQLRITPTSLYVMASNTSISELKLENPEDVVVKGIFEPISSFDLIYDGKLAIVDSKTQKMKVIANEKVEAEYFAGNKLGNFPFFSDIQFIRYNPYLNSIAVMDRTSEKSRFLRFYAAPDKPQTIRLSLNSYLQAELSWDVSPGIKQWNVNTNTGTETIKTTVTEPRFLIRNSQQTVNKYTIVAVAEDGKMGSESESIEDYYSYARYLNQNGNFVEAVAALRKAVKTINDARIDAEIVKNYLAEATAFEKNQEYEKALKSLGNAAEVSGSSVDIILQRVNVYKLMNEYRRGIEYLESLNFQSEASLMRQYISFHYLMKDFSAVINLCKTYSVNFGSDPNVLRYLATAYEKQEEYDQALLVTQQVMGVNVNFTDELKIGELQIRLQNYSVANAHLQRMLTRYINERLDLVYNLLGRSSFLDQEYGNAADFYNNAIRINKDNAEYHFGLAETYNLDRKRSEAIKYYQNAYTLNPENIIYATGYAKALERENRFPEALAILDNIALKISSSVETVDFHRFYADLLSREGRYNDAFREMSLISKYFPDDAEIKEKLLETQSARDYYNLTKAEIEIISVTFDPIYPALIEYYKRNPIGSITLMNSRNVPIRDVKITANIATICSAPIQIDIPTLLPNQEQQIELIVPIQMAVFERSMELSPELVINYVWEGSAKEIRYDRSKLNVLPDKAMNWKNRSQLASFVNPLDSAMRSFVSANIQQSYPQNSSTQLDANIITALQIYSYYRANGISYNSDPAAANKDNSSLDMVQFPFQSLNSKSGDCEDLLVLLATSLEVIGIETALIDIPGHVMLAVALKMNTEQILNSGMDLEHLFWRNERYWLPLESTTLGKTDFISSWLAARKRYQDVIDGGQMPELIEFNTAHQIYPPAPYSKAIDLAKYGESSAALSYFSEDLAKLELLGDISKEQEFTETLKRYPENLIVKNNYALWCVQKKRDDDAEKLWLEILQKDANNMAALINLGNLQTQNRNFSGARINYQKALNLSTNKENIYRNLCIMEYKNNQLAKSREYFNKLQDKEIIKQIDYQIYADLMKTGD